MWLMCIRIESVFICYGNYFDTHVQSFICDMHMFDTLCRPKDGDKIHWILWNDFISTITDIIMEKKRFNLQAPPVYDRKVTNLFFA